MSHRAWADEIGNPGRRLFQVPLRRCSYRSRQRAERWRAISAELFKIVTKADFADPDTTLGSSIFGVINLTILTSREVQLGLKYMF
jgi:hypothetical protein